MKLKRIVFSIKLNLFSNWTTFLADFLVICGVSIAVFVTSKGCVYNLSQIIDFSAKNENLTHNLIKQCLSSYESFSYFSWTMIILSFTPFGIIFPWVAVSLESYKIGLILCNLYLEYNVKGIIFGFLIVLPGLFTSLCSLLFLVPHAIKFSFSVFKQFTPNPPENTLWKSFLDYIKMVFKSILISLISPIFDFILYGMFWKFFSL